MNFIQKLTEDTLNGDWDFRWKYSDGSQNYTFNVPKHYLSGMNFSIISDPELLILPNGYGLIQKKDSLVKLRDAVNVSLERTADECVRLYLAGEEMTAEQQAVVDEQEKAKQVADKTEIKPIDNKQEKLDVGVSTRPNPTIKAPTKRQ